MESGAATEEASSASYGKSRWETVRANWISGTSVEGLETVTVEREADSRGSGVATPKAIVVEEVIDAIMIPPQNRTPGAGALPHPVPLIQMIDILVDLWEAEGLY